MKLFRVLPTAFAVATVIASSSVYANTEIEAFEQRLKELENKVAEQSEQLQYKDDQQPATLLSDIKVPEGIVFSGYARYGAAFQGSNAERVNTHGQLNGNATGRLGNEQNGGEFQLAKLFKSETGAVWDLVFMVDHWSDNAWADDGGVNVKKIYAGAVNIFESQPDLYVWAGRDFHQRPQTDINDYFWMMHDGQGGGFRNLDLGGIKLDLAAVGAVNGDYVEDSGRYALTSKLHGLKIGEADLSFYANYGGSSEKLDDDEKIAGSAYQVASELMWAGQKFIMRYSHNAKDSVYDLEDEQRAMLFSLDGSIPLSEKANLQYLTAYQTLDVAGNESRANYNVILRPTYQWNKVHSTWFETGYNVVDYDDIDATNTSWKATLSQNIAIGGETWSRPMIRFYTTVGNADNEYRQRDNNGKIIDSHDDTVTFGAMFEAWW
ncbi:carbohydrate porin [Aeromonas fluvialis]|uniref:carbohydrate porin n=1 Tax=Aeromonas fluvialis TaxID=591962 RepID=UPI0005A948AA|nr:carbohydrate porin [Aeromonas fluvialis]